MSLLLDVLFAAHARSTHHKLALDALRHLQHPAADLWRTTFLTHYPRYLAGAKDPDDRFKDFRNHVLHVRQGMWGGAVVSARKWYSQALDEFRRRNWADGVYAAGVLSHYFTDPVQPFHTHQSEAENNIHRAFEWSTTKSYENLRNLLDQRFGYPLIELEDGDEWLDDLIQRGAKLSNRFYESLIDHYDFYRGSRNPPEGLDDFSRVSLSRLLGWAIVGYARVLDRLFEEAAVIPPVRGLTMTAFFATLEMPIRWIAKKIADSGERTLIERMYAEFQATGRVDQFLPDDDRTIRDLVAARDQIRTESKTIVRETILAETRLEESSSAESSTKSKENQSKDYRQAVQQKTAATGHPAAGGVRKTRILENEGNATTKRETRTTPVATMNSPLSSMLDSGNQLATPASYSIDTRISLPTTSPTASTSRTFPPQVRSQALADPPSSVPASPLISSTPISTGLNSTPANASAVKHKIEIPELPSLDFEIPTETIPAPHVRFQESTSSEVPKPQLQSPEPRVHRPSLEDQSPATESTTRESTKPESSEDHELDPSDSSPSTQRLDAAHGGGISLDESRTVIETLDRELADPQRDRTHREDLFPGPVETLLEQKDPANDLDRHRAGESDGAEDAEDGESSERTERFRARESDSRYDSQEAENEDDSRNQSRDSSHHSQSDRSYRHEQSASLPLERTVRDSSNRQSQNPPEKRPPRYYLEFESPIVDAPSIGPKTAKRLKGCRIRTVNALLQADPGELAAALKTPQITEQVIRDWQDQARLVCGIPDLRGNDAQLLVACNVRTPRDVADSQVAPLSQRIERFGKSPAGLRILRNAATPDADEVSEWIANAGNGRGIVAESNLHSPGEELH